MSSGGFKWNVSSSRIHAAVPPTTGRSSLALLETTYGLEDGCWTSKMRAHCQNPASRSSDRGRMSRCPKSGVRQRQTRLVVQKVLPLYVTGDLQPLRVAQNLYSACQRSPPSRQTTTGRSRRFWSRQPYIIQCRLQLVTRHDNVQDFRAHLRTDPCRGGRLPDLPRRQRGLSPIWSSFVWTRRQIRASRQV